MGDAGTAYRIQPKCSFAADQVASLLTLTTQISALKIATDANVTDDKGTGIPQAQSLRSVSFTDRLVGYMTTGSGLILKTTDGGYHWIAENSTTEGNTQIALSDAENGVISTGNQVSTLRDRAQKFGTRYWYDELGRLILSQNSKQYNIKNYLGEQQYAGVETALNQITNNSITNNPIRAYSYTLYDDIGRIVEVGELVTKAPVTTYKVETQVKYKDITASTGVLNSGVKQQITRTYYDEQVYTVQVNGYPFTQENLRPRVASVTYSDRQSPAGGGAEGGSYDRATHYSYDIHGNVKSLVHEIKSNTGLSTLNSQLTKRLDYDYDLVSGKINYLYYQKNQDDQLVHKYTYDGDNRITQVYTSSNGIDWVTESKYDYYAHGPLAVSKLGNDFNVETSNYVYTLHGWIKGVKGQNFSYALGYYAMDYKAISSSVYGGVSIGLLETPVTNNDQGKSTELFNGNIATWASQNSTGIAGAIDIPWTQQFTYDQLNRIKTGTSVGAGHNYKNTYTYEGNGNLLSLGRYDKDGIQIDSFSYNYENKGKGYISNTNRLRSVDDAVSNSAYVGDLEDQGVDNYNYDDIGNLNKDGQNDISNIEWTLYGKVKAVTRVSDPISKLPLGNKPNLVFEYDVFGNRVLKTSITKDGSIRKTYYLRDQAGNIMSTYTSNENLQLSLEEQYLYGNSRLGILKNGARSYELIDHLGNIRTIVTDEGKVASASDYYPFGMTAKAYIPDAYRYGYNGKENDVETGWQDYGMRMYDNRICRFFKVDPIAPYYPWYSPYQFAANSPILFIDLDGLEPATPEQFRKTVTWVIAHKPLYLLRFSRVHYEVLAKRAYNGDASLNNSERNTLQGAVGEIIFSGRAMIGYFPFFRTAFVFNKDQSSTSALRHDVKLTLTPIEASFKRAEKGLSIRTPYGPITFSLSDIGVQVINENAENRTLMLDRKKNTELYVEVKTLGVNSYNFTNIVDGFDQAIKTAVNLKGQPNKLSILAVDETAYMNAMKDPAQKGILLEKFAELKAAGGYVMLLKNQTTKTKQEIDATAEKIKTSK